MLTLLLVVLATGCSRESDRRSAPAPEPTPPTDPPTRPSGPLEHIGGPELLERIASSGAKGTIVNAWASWCGPCRREFPMLIAMRDNLAPQGIRVVFISMDEPESEQTAHDFATERGLPEPIWVAQRPLGEFKTALNPSWPGMLPATFLFDDKGKLRYFWGGPVYEQELLPIIEGFLAGKDIDGQSRFGLSPGKDYRNE